MGPEGELELRGGPAWHLSKVLRARPGEVVTLILPDGLEHQVRLERLAPDQVLGRVLSSAEPTSEPHTSVHLAQAIPKGSGMSEVCERLAELGAASIWPLVTERTVVRPAPAAVAAKVRHWQAVAREAAQLAGRAAAPEVHQPLALPDLPDRLRQALPGAQLLVCHRDAESAALESVPWSALAPSVVLVGPEGGWAQAELDLVARHGAVKVSLGPRNLRSVLAGLVALTLLLARGGDLRPARTASAASS